jgi:alkyldihydroxyacetonephosphate synthase
MMMEGGVGGGDSHGSARRLSVLRGHLSAGARTVAAVQASGTSSSYSAPVSSSKDERQRAYPRKRQSVVKWNGWGYRDSYFFFNPSGQAEFNGRRYELGGKEMPLARMWMEHKVGLEISLTSFSQVW